MAVLVSSPPPLDLYSQGPEAVRLWYEGHTYLAGTSPETPIVVAPASKPKPGVYIVDGQPMSVAYPERLPANAVYVGPPGTIVPTQPVQTVRPSTAPAAPSLIPQSIPKINQAKIPQMQTTQATYTPTKTEAAAVFGLRTEKVYTYQGENLVDVQKRIGFGPTGYDPATARAQRSSEVLMASPYGLLVSPLISGASISKKLKTGMKTGDVGGQVFDIFKTDIPIVSPLYQTGAGIAKGNYEKAFESAPLFGTGYKIGKAAKAGDVELAGAGLVGGVAEAAMWGVGGVGAKPTVKSVGLGRYTELPRVSAFDMALVTRSRGMFSTRTFVSRVKGVVETPATPTALSKGTAELKTYRLSGSRYLKQPERSFEFTLAKPIIKTEKSSFDIISGIEGVKKTRSGFGGVSLSQKLPSETIYGKSLMASQAKGGGPVFKAQIKTFLRKDTGYNAVYKGPDAAGFGLKTKTITSQVDTAAQYAAANVVKDLVKSTQIKATPLPTGTVATFRTTTKTKQLSKQREIQASVYEASFLSEQSLAQTRQQAQSQRQLQRELEQQEQRNMQGLVVFQEPVQTQKQRQSQRQLERLTQTQDQSQRQLQKQLTRQTTTQLTRQQAAFSRTYRSYKASGAGFGLPSFRIPTRGMSISPRQPKRAVAQYGYTPSAGAVLFGITARKKPALWRTEIIRPVIIPGLTRRRRIKRRR